MRIFLVALLAAGVSGCGSVGFGMAPERATGFQVSGPAPGMKGWVPILERVHALKKTVLCPKGTKSEGRYVSYTYQPPDPQYESPYSPGYAWVEAETMAVCNGRAFF